MEEQQIEEFVRQVSVDAGMRKKLMDDPEGVIRKEGYTSHVSEVLMSLVPHLSLDKEIGPSFRWWD